MAAVQSPRFGKWLRDQRSRADKTGYDAAKFLGIQPRSYYDFEAGLRSPAIPVIIQLCSYYHMNVAEVVDKLKQENPRKAQELEIIRSYFEK